MVVDVAVVVVVFSVVVVVADVIVVDHSGNQVFRRMATLWSRVPLSKQNSFIDEIFRCLDLFEISLRLEEKIGMPNVIELMMMLFHLIDA